jgi:hypothetical protein
MTEAPGSSPGLVVCATALHVTPARGRRRREQVRSHAAMVADRPDLRRETDDVVRFRRFTGAVTSRRTTRGSLAIRVAFTVATGIAAVPVLVMISFAIAHAQAEPPSMPDRQGSEIFGARNVLEAHVQRGIGVAQADELVATMPTREPGAARMVLGTPLLADRAASVTVLLVSSAPDRLYVCETFRVDRDASGLAIAEHVTLGECPDELADAVPRGARLPEPRTLEG